MGCPDKGECVVKVCKEEEDETRENGVTVFSYSEKDVKQCVHKQTGWTRANYSEVGVFMAYGLWTVNICSLYLW